MTEAPTWETRKGVTTYYVRSSVLGGQVISELNGSGTVQRGYVYTGGQLLALQNNGGVQWVSQEPYSKGQRITDGSGNIVATVELDPWRADTGLNSNSAFQPHRFTTYERDSNGSDDAMARRYNRYWSRFDQPDPYDGSSNLGAPQSFNRYAYTQNDPVNFTDPTGLISQCIPIYMENQFLTWSCQEQFRDRYDYGFTGFNPRHEGNGGTEKTKPKPNCSFPTYDQLSAVQQGLLNGLGGASAYGGLSDAQRANFLNQTGALNRAGINLGPAALQANGIHTDRLLFAPGRSLDTFRGSVEASIASNEFIKDKPIAKDHPGMSAFGARQSVTTNALQMGFGSAGAFVDIDRGGARTDVFGFLIHAGEVVIPGSTDPFSVGRALGSKVTGYTCK